MSNLIRFDWAFKRLLRQKANFVVLEGLLTSLLGKSIRIVRILESEGNKQYLADKFNRVDILAECDNKEKVIIEIQNNRELDYFHRMLYGTAKVVTEYINAGEEYAKIKKVYSVNIVYFELGQGEDYVYRGTTEFKGIYKKDVLQLSKTQQEQFQVSDLKDIYPEYYVLRVEDFNASAVTPLDEWVSFLKTGEIPLSARAPGLQEARERLRADKMSKSERQRYNHHLENLRYQRSVIKTGIIEGIEEGEKRGIEKGLKEGLKKGFKKGLKEGLKEGLKKGEEKGLKKGKEEGLKKGKEEEKKEIAQKLLDQGMSIKDIAKITGLSEAEIKKNEKG
jgi:predicted transposase/invertase (TIGR01784 family)